MTTEKPKLPAKFDPEATYAVQLAKNVEIFGQMQSPGPDLKLTGAVCEQVRGSIYSAEVLQDGHDGTVSS